MNVFDYKWLWSRIGGRKWTFIIRDARQKHPTQWMLGVLVFGATIGRFFWSWELLGAFGVLLVGILWGHLWWGTKYVPNKGLKITQSLEGGTQIHHF